MTPDQHPVTDAPEATDDPAHLADDPAEPGAGTEPGDTAPTAADPEPADPKPGDASVGGPEEAEAEQPQLAGAEPSSADEAATDADGLELADGPAVAEPHVNGNAPADDSTATDDSTKDGEAGQTDGMPIGETTDAPGVETAEATDDGTAPAYGMPADAPGEAAETADAPGDAGQADGMPADGETGAAAGTPDGETAGADGGAAGAGEVGEEHGAGGPVGVPDLASALEAVLMVVDEPIPAVQLAQVLETPRVEVEQTLHRLAAEYTEAGRGFDLRAVAGGWRFYSRPECAPVVERFILDGQQARLTQAALETLAVIAYRQPVSRARVSAIRGVNCDGVVRTLVNRGLIEEAGTEQESNALLYRTTTYFLERLGLQNLEELPDIAPYLPEVDDLDDAEEVAG